MPTDRPKRIVALISGRGSNMLALLDAMEDGRIAGEITLVISNRSDTEGGKKAAARGVPTDTVDINTYADKQSFEAALADRITAAKPDLIVLAGFMHILSATFVARMRCPIMNIHPSLLPAYRGLNTHQRVLDAGATEHGCSIHFVTAELDAGPLIAQAKVKVFPGKDTCAELAARVLSQEHKLYPAVVALFCAGELEQGQRYYLSDAGALQPLPATTDN